ncbi:hypothetical protein FB451DRAFT_1143935 [Mycena latifolia]|nr:hypothetical protein FB451DRAFT_1143935 [Mycena latifolia]
MADNLPDEIVSEILSPALKVPEAMFSDMSPKSPFATYSRVSSSAALLVCKAWLRVATPLLYNVVVIRSKAQARALCASLKGAPELGRFIKKLRVEGGFGSFMYHILRCTPNVSDLFLSLHLHSSDSSAGLELGLPLINPSRVIIDDDNNNLLKNKAVVQLMGTLEMAVKKWTNLNKIYFPYDSGGDARESFFKALCACPTLKMLSFPVPQASLFPPLIQIAKLPSLEAIEIRPKTATRKETKKPITSEDPRLASLLRWEEPPTQPSIRRYRLTTRPPANPHFRPMESTPQPVADLIWSRILLFAMTSLVPRPKNLIQQRRLDYKTNVSRLQFLLVSKMFQRLAIPYLYRYPLLIRQDSVPRFSTALIARPAVGPHVRRLDIRSTAPAFALQLPAAEFDLAPILSRTSNLTRLIGDGNVPISWQAFTALAETAGGTLELFAGFVFLPPTETSYSPSVFSNFTALKSLTWQAKQVSDPVLFLSLFTPVRTSVPFFVTEAVDPGSLPSLEFLRARTSEVLGVFTRLTLPNLHRVMLEVKELAGDAFLRSHGHNIWLLKVPRTSVGTESVFTLCPNLATLYCTLRSGNDYDIGLNEEFKHVFLTKLILIKPAEFNNKEEEKAWRLVAAALDFAHLPALRELNISACEWPTTEHGITKSVWVEWAERLLHNGIRLTDKAGADWRPRLKVSRR